jgi:hypothetical protein
MWLVRDPCGLMTVVLAYTMLWFGVLCVGMCVLAPWMGGTAGGALHSFALYALAGLTNVCHLRAMLTDPGAVPPGAQQPLGTARSCALVARRHRHTHTHTTHSRKCTRTRTPEHTHTHTHTHTRTHAHMRTQTRLEWRKGASVSSASHSNRGGRTTAPRVGGASSKWITTVRGCVCAPLCGCIYD